MVALNQLGNAEYATTTFRGYPPAASLFSYFWIKISGAYNESDAFRSANIFLFALILPVFKNFTWKKSARILAVFIIALLLPPMFNATALTTIYVDTLLGFLFAFSLFQYFTSDYRLRELLLICLPLFSLPLVKASGTGIALLAVIIMILDIFFVRIQRSGKQRAAWSICLSFALFAGKFSWDIYLRLTNTKEAWDTSKLTFSGISNLLLGRGEEYQYSTIYNFLRALVKDSQYGLGHIVHLTAIWWGILFLILSAIFILCLKHNLRHRYVLCLFSVETGFFIYTFSLLLLYLFTYTAYEAERLASFTRYLSTYLSGMFAFLIYLFIYLWGSKDKFKKINICYPLLVFILLCSNYTNIFSITVGARSSIEASIKVRREREIPQSVLDKLNERTDHVYIISQQDNGFNKTVLYYEFTPVNAATPAWSLGPPYYEGDIWTKSLTEEEFAKALKDYTHLYIDTADNQFKNLYGSLFEDSNSIKDKTLFCINKQGTTVKLTTA